MRNAFLILPILLLLSSAARAEDPRWEKAPLPTQAQQKEGQQTAQTQAVSPLEEQREQTLLKVLKKPPIPIKAPDKIIRVLFLPYVDKSNILNNYRYSFIKVEEGNWVLGDYLIEPARLDKQVFHPLDNPATGVQQQQQQVAKPNQKKIQKPNETKPTVTDMKQYQQQGNQQQGNQQQGMNKPNSSGLPVPIQQ
jgi:hypothetical protein